VGLAAREDEGVFVFYAPLKLLSFFDGEGLGHDHRQVHIVGAIGGAFDFLDFNGSS